MYEREAYNKMWLIFQLVDSIEWNGTRAFVEVAFLIVACQNLSFFVSNPSMACVENMKIKKKNIIHFD